MTTEKVLSYFKEITRIPRESGHEEHIIAYLQEFAQVAIAAPVPLAFFLFVVNPEDVGGDDGDAAGSHLLNLAPPFMLGHTAVVYLAHDGQDVLAADDEAAAVNLECDAVRVGAGAEAERFLCRKGDCSNEGK